MRLERKREAEIARRKGTATRTFLAIFWLVLCFGLSYYIANWLFETGALTTRFFYSRLFIPRSIDQWVLVLTTAVVLTLLMQFFVLVGYAFAAPMGRMRPGNPSLRKKDPNADESPYRYS